MVSDGGLVAGIVAMLQKDGMDVPMMLQNAKEFRPAIPAMSDDPDGLFQVD